MHLDRDTNLFHVTDRHRYPVSTVRWNDLGDETLGFAWHERAIRLDCESGSWLSVIWGEATYSSNHDAWLNQSFTETPDLVEVLPSWLDEPEGYVDPTRMLELIDEANNRGGEPDGAV